MMYHVDPDLRGGNLSKVVPIRTNDLINISQIVVNESHFFLDTSDVVLKFNVQHRYISFGRQ